MQETIILGIKVNKSVTNTIGLQQILSKYGCSIKTRLGLHEPAGDYSSTSQGLLILELHGSSSEAQNMENELKSIENLEIQKMVFTQ